MAEEERQHDRVEPVRHAAAHLLQIACRSARRPVAETVGTAAVSVTRKHPMDRFHRRLPFPKRTPVRDSCTIAHGAQTRAHEDWIEAGLRCTMRQLGDWTVSSEGQSDIVLRRATAADAAAVAGLWAQAFPLKFRHVFGAREREFLTEWFERDPSVFGWTTLALRGEQAAGYIQLETPGETSARKADGRLSPLWAYSRMIGPLLSIASRRLGLLASLPCVARLAYMGLGSVAPGTMCVEMLGVDSECRGQGIGSKLLEFAEKEARQRGLQRLTLGVVVENEGARRLYERHGYRVTGEHHPWLMRWASGCAGYYEMHKALTGSAGPSQNG